MIEQLIPVISILPTEMLVKKLKRSIVDWESNKSDDNFNQMVFDAHCLMLKKISDGTLQGAEKVIKDMKKIEHYRQMFSNKEN